MIVESSATNDVRERIADSDGDKEDGCGSQSAQEPSDSHFLTHSPSSRESATPLDGLEEGGTHAGNSFPSHLDILLINPGDIRHILTSMKGALSTTKPRTIHVAQKYNSFSFA